MEGDKGLESLMKRRNELSETRTHDTKNLKHTHGTFHGVCGVELATRHEVRKLFDKVVSLLA